jgi:hypothetical protein
MARRDYIDDPHAPAANSVVPSVVAVVRDEQGPIAHDPPYGQRLVGTTWRWP